MSDTVIRVDGLSKRYRIGEARPKYGTLRDTLVSAAQLPMRALRRESRSNAQDFWALRDVSFEVKQGEILGIIGRNGAGKSTLLKILSRITEPTTGQVRMRGRVRSLLEVGTGFHPELTGRENIYLNGAILGMKREEINQKFDAIAEFAEIEQFLDTPVKRYSSGMYMRLAFSIAAHLEPEILIVDEVLAVGDAAFQQKCLGAMSRVAGQGRTVLFVSHNMAAIQSLCTRGLYLQNGSISKDATALEAIQSYLGSLEQVQSQELLQRTDRAGKGQARLARVEITPGDGDPSRSLAIGESAKFVFRLNAILPKTSCGFTIYDHMGQPITHLNSVFHSPEDSADASIGPAFACHLDELPLVPGRYRINVAVSSDGELQDHVEAAAVFEVEPGVLRGRPITAEATYGSVIMPHRWTLPV
jgi:lipopolysaccharide transport system ATP-binding protein